MSKSEKAALLYNQDIPVGRLLIPLEVDYMVNRGEYYRRIGYDFEKDAAIFLKQKEQSPLMEKYWDYDTKDWTPLTKSEMNAGAFGPQPSYTLTIERANELLAEQDKKIIELTEDNHRLKGIADSAMKANDEMHREYNKLHKENESLMKANDALLHDRTDLALKVKRLEKDIVELTEINQRERSRAIDASDRTIDTLKENESLRLTVESLMAEIQSQRKANSLLRVDEQELHKKIAELRDINVMNHRENQRLEKVLSEISITAGNATKQKANSVSFADAAENSKFKPFYNFEDRLA